MTPDGRKAYTCNKTAPFISILDLENECMIGKINVPSTEEPNMSLDGRHVYFPIPGFEFGVNPKDPAIEIIDTATDRIIKSIKLTNGVLPVHVSPGGLILAGQYHFADKANELSRPNNAYLGIYDAHTYAYLGEIPIGLWPLTLRCSQDGKTAFSANVIDGTVTVIDLESKAVVKTIQVDNERRAHKKGHVGAHGLAFIP